MTRDELLALPYRTTLLHKTERTASGPLRCRINGKPRLWKRQPDYFELPVKHGLRTCFYITPSNLDDWEPESAALNHNP